MSQLKGSVFMMHLSSMIFLLSILLSFVMVESDGKNKWIQNKHITFSSQIFLHLSYLTFLFTKDDYGPAYTHQWCKDAGTIDARNGCTSDVTCLNNARKFCDGNPQCYGVGWYEKNKIQKIRICRSTKMIPKNDGWRTMMKTGEFILAIYSHTYIRFLWRMNYLLIN